MLNCDHPDVNECSDGTHTCQQRCNNTHGAFQCSCDSGFVLRNDGFSCRGECILYSDLRWYWHTLQGTLFSNHYFLAGSSGYK